MVTLDELLDRREHRAAARAARQADTFKMVPLPDHSATQHYHQRHSQFRSQLALPQVEITSEIILSPAFIVELDDLLNRREQRADARYAHQVDTFRMEEATSSRSNTHHHHQRRN